MKQWLTKLYQQFKQRRLAQKKCQGVVRSWVGKNLREFKCGSWHDGKVLCAPCEARAHLHYPQGWRYYPGDVCRHGTYVGGCGVDWICGRCEYGESTVKKEVNFFKPDRRDGKGFDMALFAIDTVYYDASGQVEWASRDFAIRAYWLTSRLQKVFGVNG